MMSQRWSFLKELVAIAFFLLALDYTLYKGMLFRWTPSPLWLLILWIAPRHGTVAGFACGLASSFIYLWVVSEQGYLWQDILHRQPELMIKPGLFLLCGVYLGTLSERQTKRWEYFKAQAATLASQLESSEIKRAELERSTIDMEKRIAGQTATLLTLQTSFKKLDAAHSEDELFFALDLILREESQAKTCGIWRIAGKKATLAAGGPDGPVPPLALKISRYRKVATAADYPLYGEDKPGTDLAALISDRESERLVITLGGIPFARLTRNLALRVSLQADQAGLVLGAIRDREKLQSMAALDAESGLVSETYLRRRLNEEIALARRHKTLLALLACSITASNPNLQPGLETALSCSIRACIRFSDGFSYFPHEKAFVIVLPQCDEEGARIVLKKIETNFEMLNLRDKNNCAIFKISWRIHSSAGDLDGEESLKHLLTDECEERRP